MLCSFCYKRNMSIYLYFLTCDICDQEVNILVCFENSTGTQLTFIVALLAKVSFLLGLVYGLFRLLSHIPIIVNSHKYSQIIWNKYRFRLLIKVKAELHCTYMYRYYKISINLPVLNCVCNMYSLCIVYVQQKKLENFQMYRLCIDYV